MENPKTIPNGAYPNRPLVAVGAVVFNKGKVLLVLRAKSPAKNHWTIPGGCVELGETLQEAAEREIREETGLTIEAGEPVYTFDVIERDANGAILFHYVIVDLAADYVSGELRPGDDATDVCWASFKDVKRLKVSDATRKLLKECYNSWRDEANLIKNQRS
ncbi:MAG: NUDIX hydrolase [Deltaproteobacteria bacterium]|nr:NUDIX hydrolase [Deltaproteobacteria bacterium]MBW2679971.1 NUDIX hydrolase [Deltaproteobacteria bacterium]